MRFLTLEECQAFTRDAGYQLDNESKVALPSTLSNHVCRGIPGGHARLMWFSRHLAQSLDLSAGCLLWLTEWGVWPSSENPHLVSRLRHSYSENRLVHEAPGHLFGPSEESDLITFVQISVLSGWGGHVLCVGGTRAFFSHDEFVEFTSPTEAAMAKFAEPLPSFGRSPAA